MTQIDEAELEANRHRIQRTLEFTTVGEVFSARPKLLRKVYYECYSGTWTVGVGANSYTIPYGGKGNAMKVGDVHPGETFVGFRLDELSEGSPASIYVHIEWQDEETEWSIGYTWDF